MQEQKREKRHNNAKKHGKRKKTIQVGCSFMKEKKVNNRVILSQRMNIQKYVIDLFLNNIYISEASQKLGFKNKFFYLWLYARVCIYNWVFIMQGLRR
jgi:hypothetical protein